MNNFENKWNQEELDQWFDTLAQSQQDQIYKVLIEAKEQGKDVLRLCNLIRDEMEDKGLVLLKSTVNKAKFDAIFNGFQDGIIRWRLFSGNVTEKNIFF